MTIIHLKEKVVGNVFIENNVTFRHLLALLPKANITFIAHNLSYMFEPQIFNFNL